MKARKIFDGVYEFPSWKPEKIGTLNVGFDYDHRINVRCANDQRSNRMRHVITNAQLIAINDYHFRPEYAGTAWHEDGAQNSGTWTHVLILIACDNPKLGTEIRDKSGLTFKCKTWTPYLIRSDTTHRSAVGPWDCSRLMYRLFLKLDEATLDIDT